VTSPERACRIAGIVLQAVVLGEALFMAIVTLYAMQSGAQLFRYAGF
jgi:hypothetical protein